MTLAGFSRVVRRVHMYLALFLTPWMLAYALSSLVFNHGAAIRNWYGGNPNRFERVEEREYRREFPPETPAPQMAEAILGDLGLEGSHFVQGQPTPDRMIINRQGGLGVYRITWLRREQRVVLEKQVPTLANFLLRLHLRHGYEQPYAAAKAWGLAVELTVLAMLFWIASGLWLWWEIRPARRWGAVAGIGGLGIFALLLVTI